MTRKEKEKICRESFENASSSSSRSFDAHSTYTRAHKQHISKSRESVLTNPHNRVEKRANTTSLTDEVVRYRRRLEEKKKKKKKNDDDEKRIRRPYEKNMSFKSGTFRDARQEGDDKRRGG